MSCKLFQSKCSQASRTNKRHNFLHYIWILVMQMDEFSLFIITDFTSEFSKSKWYLFLHACPKCIRWLYALCVNPDTAKVLTVKNSKTCLGQFLSFFHFDSAKVNIQIREGSISSYLTCERVKAEPEAKLEPAPELGNECLSCERAKAFNLSLEINSLRIIHSFTWIYVQRKLVKGTHTTFD